MRRVGAISTGPRSYARFSNERCSRARRRTRQVVRTWPATSWGAWQAGAATSRRIRNSLNRPRWPTMFVARPTVVLDTGPLIALLDRDETHHDWASARFDTLSPPLLTCEAVLSEASFLLHRADLDPGLPVELVVRGVLEVSSPVTTRDDAVAVRSLMRRARRQPYVRVRSVLRRTLLAPAQTTATRLVSPSFV